MGASGSSGAIGASGRESGRGGGRGSGTGGDAGSGGRGGASVAGTGGGHAGDGAGAGAAGDSPGDAGNSSRAGNAAGGSAGTPSAGCAGTFGEPRVVLDPGLEVRIYSPTLSADELELFYGSTDVTGMIKELRRSTRTSKLELALPVDFGGLPVTLRRPLRGGHGRREKLVDTRSAHALTRSGLRRKGERAGQATTASDIGTNSRPFDSNAPAGLHQDPQRVHGDERIAFALRERTPVRVSPAAGDHVRLFDVGPLDGKRAVGEPLLLE